MYIELYPSAENENGNGVHAVDEIGAANIHNNNNETVYRTQNRQTDRLNELIARTSINIKYEIT